MTLITNDPRVARLANDRRMLDEMLATVVDNDDPLGRLDAVAEIGGARAGDTPDPGATSFVLCAAAAGRALPGGASWR